MADPVAAVVCAGGLTARIHALVDALGRPIFAQSDSRAGASRTIRSGPCDREHPQAAETLAAEVGKRLFPAAGSPHVPYGSVPARKENLDGLPPAFIGVGSIDLFVDEDIEYARRLANAGIPVALNVVPGAFHGFGPMPNSLVKPFRDSLYTALGDAFNAAR